MELKVWVEGIQRVVCGITEQTTVQEVVIALAQATGRTGRYTLVEKCRGIEKLLPPTEHPIKVLEKWGEYSSAVQFLLKRTGASTTSSDIENTKAPERNVYRQSLPPPSKTRDKSEILQGLRRKEPKRKSLTIAGGGKQYAEGGQEKGNQNTNGNNNRSSYIPPEENSSSRYDRANYSSVPASVRKAADRFSANLSTSESSKKELTKPSKEKDGKSKSKSKGDKKSKDDGRSAKTALIPPHLRNQDEKTSGETATRMLFPSESKSEVEAKSPTRKTDNQIKNVNIKGAKVPLMPPTSKVLRNRNQSSSFETPQQSLNNESSSSNHTNSNSDSLSPSTFSLPNENKLANYSYRYGNSLPRKKKSWSDNNNAIQDDSRRPTNKEASRRSAMMPPNYKQRAMTPNPQLHREAFQSNSNHGHYPTSPMSLAPARKVEQDKARDDFSKLVTEQQKHIEEQQDTVSALDKEIKNIIDAMQQRDRELETEINQLQEKNRSLEVQLKKEINVAEELSAEESKGNFAKKELVSLQEKIDRLSVEVASHRRKNDDLAKAVNEESLLQKAKQQRIAENNRNLTNRSKKDIEQVNWNLSSMEEEIRRIEKEISIRDEDVGDKYSALETLNRELRQVNLQQFIRKTGSKVTVLPPETQESETIGSHYQQSLYDSNSVLGHSGSHSPITTAPPPPSGNSEGVWV